MNISIKNINNCEKLDSDKAEDKTPAEKKEEKKKKKEKTEQIK